MTQVKQLVVCVDDDGYPASLEKRKIYVALRDAAAEKHNMLRIVDESGEDYLYPKVFFRSIATRGAKPTCNGSSALCLRKARHPATCVRTSVWKASCRSASQIRANISAKPWLK